jgi:ribosomal protein S1
MPRSATVGRVEGVVEHTATFGVFVELEAGLVLIPGSETDLPKGRDLASSFPGGTRVAATVLSVEPERKRISLSLKKAKESKAVKDFRRWKDERQAERKVEVTAFGAALIKALKQPQEPKQ